MSNRTRDAADLDERLARRIACFTDGRCPHCEATFGRATFENRLGHMAMEHEDWCPVPDDEEVIPRLARKHGFKLRPVFFQRGETTLIGLERV